LLLFCCFRFVLFVAHSTFSFFFLRASHTTFSSFSLPPRQNRIQTRGRRRWPKAVIQFEDFSIDVARPLLDRYRNWHTVFNDDIQGTACTALGGLYSALRVQGLPREALCAQRVVVVGAGSAGMGVVETLARGMARSGGVSLDRAAARFWVLDKDGLITDARGGLAAHVSPFARRHGYASAADKSGDDAAALADAEGESLLSVVRRVRPTVLLGLAGAGKLFTADVLRAVADGCASHAGRDGLAPRPIVFAMSNPTSKLECTSQEAHDHTGGSAVYASGSPQPDVVVNGKARRTGQANNLYIFGGLSLGASLARARRVTDGMLMAAAEVLPELVSEKDVSDGLIFPPLSEIRRVSAAVAAAVMKAAHAEGLVTDPTALGALSLSPERLERWVTRRMWRPTTHTSLAYLPPGIDG
jgi:malate dehydrogenase (decarboxylating)